MKQHHRILIKIAALGLTGLLASGCFAPKWLWPFGGASSWDIRVVNCPKTFRQEVNDIEVTLLARGRAPQVRHLPLLYSDNGNVYSLTIKKESLLQAFGRSSFGDNDSLIVNFERFIDPWIVLMEDSSGVLVSKDSVKIESDQVRLFDCDEVRRHFELSPEQEFSFVRAYTIFRTSSEERLSLLPGKDDRTIRTMPLVFDSTRGTTECFLQNPCDFGRPDTTQ